MIFKGYGSWYYDEWQGNNVQYYDGGIDGFIPFNASDVYFTASGDIITLRPPYRRAVEVRPINTEITTNEVDSYSNLDRMYNGNTANYASISDYYLEIITGTHAFKIDLDIPTPTGVFNQGQISITYEVIINNTPHVDADVDIRLTTNDNNYLNSGIWNDLAKTTDTQNLSSAIASNVSLNIYFNTVNSKPIDAEVRIYDVSIKHEVKTAEDDKIETVYVGSEGATHGITGWSGTSIETVDEAHLDLLNRYSGFDVPTSPYSDIRWV